MSKWIDIDDAIEIVTKIQGMWATTLHALCDAPSIDLVRCKECKHYFYDELNDCKMCYIHEYGEIWEDNDFCSYGEKESE